MEPIFSGKVAVIVPVFNAPKEVQALLDSLSISYPEPIPQLRFIFSDDHSPDPRLRKLYDKHPFFHRPDVTVIRHRTNLGYTFNVNGAIGATRGDEDIVLLNSDTEVAPGLFEHLNGLAQSLTVPGSITPLTNNGTIASLINWPTGGDFTFGLLPHEVTNLIKEMPLRSETIEVPTPIGFCMYLPRFALNQVGLFDEKTFPRGYGEENDWALRATKVGFKHYLSLRHFVYHKAGRSFKDESSPLIQGALKKLNEKYPDYAGRVQRFIQSDFFKVDRLSILLALYALSRSRSKRKCYLEILHKDPSNFSGGVESHVSTLTGAYVRGGDDVIQLYPKDSGWRINYLSKSLINWEMTIPNSLMDPASLLKSVAEQVDVIHVHHYLSLTNSMNLFLRSYSKKVKVITLHDFFSICPSINLIGPSRSYCQIPTETSACVKCQAGMYGNPGFDIGEYRNQQAAFLDSFDQILTPSAEAKALIGKGLALAPQFLKRPKGLKSFLNKISVAANPTPKIRAVESNFESKFNGRLIFLGAFSVAKGAEIISQALPFLAKLGFDAQIWGQVGAVKTGSPVPIVSYQGISDLVKLAPAARGSIVCLPALWPETFSFTLYEALTVLNVPVVVGPYGHPASLVKREGLGSVMGGPNSKELLVAIQDCKIHYRERSLALKNFLIKQMDSQGNQFEAFNSFRPSAPTPVPSAVGRRTRGREVQL